MDEATLALSIPIIAVAGSILAWMLTIIFRMLERTVRFYGNVKLKLRLIDAGMSAYEIERVVNAGLDEPPVDQESYISKAG